jgi:hypothetical protein
MGWAQSNFLFRVEFCLRIALLCFGFAVGRRVLPAVKFLAAQLRAVRRMQYLGDHFDELRNNKRLADECPSVIQHQQRAVMLPRH